MPMVFCIPGYLRNFTDGRERVEINSSARTVGEALEVLCAQCPGIRDRILDEQGEVRQHVNIFAGNESIRMTGGLATPVADDAELLIVPAVSGG